MLSLNKDQVVSNLFVVSLEYLVPIETVDQYLLVHREFLDRGYRDGIFIVSGRKVPRTGGMILAQAKSKESLETLINSDPFKVHGVARYSITEFEPTRYNESLTNVVAVSAYEKTS